MAIFGRVRIDIKKEKVEAGIKEVELKVAKKEAGETEDSAKH